METKKVLQKWLPIMEHLKIDKKYQEIFSTYAELCDERILVEDGITENLLPVNLKVLSELNFDKLNIKLIDTITETIEFKETITVKTKDSIIELENKLLDNLIDFLNTKSQIEIYKLVSCIGISENEIFIRSRISFK